MFFGTIGFHTETPGCRECFAVFRRGNAVSRAGQRGFRLRSFQEALSGHLRGEDHSESEDAVDAFRVELVSARTADETLLLGFGGLFAKGFRDKAPAACDAFQAFRVAKNLWAVARAISFSLLLVLAERA